MSRVVLLGLALAACGDNLRPPPPDAVDPGPVDAAVRDAAAPDAAGDAGGDDAGGDAAGGDDAAVDAAGLDSGCRTEVAAFPLVAGAHVAQCSVITYASNPPTSGPHYPLWARYKTYADRVPRGFWVHDLEHGAVVVTYNCPGSCAADVAALTAFLAGRPADPLCAPPVQARVIVTPDPLLDTRFAASAWGWALRSDCFDLVALGAFLDAHYGMGPESTCADGFDPTAPGSGVPADCP